MQDLNDQVTGGLLSADDFNEIPTEIQNVITDTGQTLSGGDLDQLGKGIAQYVGNGDYYADSGSINAYVLTSIGDNQPTTSYVDGMKTHTVVI